MPIRLIVVLFVLAACSGPPSVSPSPMPTPLAKAVPGSIEAALAAPVLGVLRSMVGDAPPTMPFVRVLHGKTACRGHLGVNPYAIPGLPGPRVGQEWQCLFVTSACPRPAEPGWPAWIVTAARPLPQSIDFTPFGMPGCWLLVAPDLIVTVPAAAETGMLRRAPGSGQVRLHWTPGPGSVGATHWFQFVTLSPSGWLSSPAVEVVVGSAR